MISENIPQNTALMGLFEKARSGLFFHAVILEGKEREEAALAYAGACVCSGENVPCGECTACRKVKAGIHPDVYVPQPTGASRSISVESIRFIREDAYIKPNEAPRKVYLLKDAEDMTPVAQNALLKVLEEPPDHVVFIMTCRNARDLLPTVLSRSQIFSLSDVREDTQISETTEQFVEYLLREDARSYVFLTAPLIAGKDRFIQFLAQLSRIFRDALLYQAADVPVSPAAQKAGDYLTAKALIRLYELADETQKSAENKKLVLNQNLLVSSFFAAAKEKSRGNDSSF